MTKEEFIENIQNAWCLLKQDKYEALNQLLYELQISDFLVNHKKYSLILKSCISEIRNKHFYNLSANVNDKLIFENPVYQIKVLLTKIYNLIKNDQCFSLNFFLSNSDQKSMDVPDKKDFDFRNRCL